MTRIGAAASLAILAAIAIAVPSNAQTGSVSAGGGRSVGAVVRVPGPVRGIEAGNFPMLGLPVQPITSAPRTNFRFGYDRSDRPDGPDRPHRRHHRDRRDQDYYYAGGIGGFVGSGVGYFAERGEASRGDDGHVDYDYDRGYPYDHYAPREERELAYETAPRDSFCETVWARGGRSGERVPVNVCRN